MKTFKYKNYKDCYFRVSQYTENPKAMAILIEKNDELYAVCTVNHFLGVYTDNITTIKNYSENDKMTQFLKKLGVIKQVIESVNISPFPETKSIIDICLIDIEKLKEYTKEYSYNV